MGETIDKSIHKKKYDLIYFANDIAKAGEIVLRTMRDIVKLKPHVKLCVVGGCSNNFASSFYRLIRENALDKNVEYLGKLTTHQDVIDSVKSSRVALLPVKLDAVTGTMRGSMANGVPVVTTKTWGTPSLNEKRKSAFIEELNDYSAMAADVLLLLDNETVYNEIMHI